MAKTFSPFGKQPPPIPQMPKVALDRFGHLIEPGHLVMYHAPNDLLLEVVAVHPVVNPAAQGGMAIQMTLRAQFNIQGASGVPAGSLVIVGETQERIAAKAGNNGHADATGPSSQADGHADSSEGPKLILTDGDMPTEPDIEAEAGTCPACGDTGRPGTACIDCGAGIYQA